MIIISIEGVDTHTNRRIFQRIRRLVCGEENPLNTITCNKKKKKTPYFTPAILVLYIKIKLIFKQIGPDKYVSLIVFNTPWHCRNFQMSPSPEDLGEEPEQNAWKKHRALRVYRTKTVNILCKFVALSKKKKNRCTLRNKSPGLLYLSF